MASQNAFVLSLLAFSLTFPFLTPSCRSQSDYSPSSSGPELGERMENGGVFVVAPKIEDCDEDTYYNTVSFYFEKYTVGLSIAIFYFPPGNHTLSQIWDFKKFQECKPSWPRLFW